MANSVVTSKQVGNPIRRHPEQPAVAFGGSAGAGQVVRMLDGVGHGGRTGHQRLIAPLECGVDRVFRAVSARPAHPDLGMGEADVRQDALVQTRRVVRAQTRDAGTRERDVGQRLMLHAGEVLVFRSARPGRLGDKADVLVRVTFNEGVLPGENAPGIAAELDHVGHRDAVRIVAQCAAQRGQPVPWHRDQNGLTLL